MSQSAEQILNELIETEGLSLDQALAAIKVASVIGYSFELGLLAQVHPADTLGPVMMEVIRRAGLESGQVDQVVGGVTTPGSGAAGPVTQ